MEGDATPDWERRRGAETARIVRERGPGVAQRIADGRLAEAYTAFEAAVTEWLGARRATQSRRLQRP
eukprot:2035102-Lingulodinium_polyedra.AAC.1